MINVSLLAAFFEWNWSRLKNPFVISGIVVMLLGVILVIFSNKIAYSIALKLKESDDKKLANIGLIVKGMAFIVTFVGAFLAVTLL